jgi:hypothetical protein
MVFSRTFTERSVAVAICRVRWLRQSERYGGGPAVCSGRLPARFSELSETRVNMHRQRQLQ